MHDVQRREVSRTELNAEQEGSPSCVHANQGWRSKQPPGRPTEGAAGALGDLRRNLLTAKFMRLVTKTTELRNLYSEYMFNIVIRERRRAWGGGGEKEESGGRRKEEKGDGGGGRTGREEDYKRSPTKALFRSLHYIFSRHYVCQTTQIWEMG